MNTTESPLVLIVEDEPLIARMISLMLGTKGFRVHIAPNAEAALRDVAALRPTLITLDLNLPGMSGHTLLQHLRAMPATTDLPVLIISALQDIPLDTRVRANAALIKPFEMDEFLALVAALLAQHQSLLAHGVGEARTSAKIGELGRKAQQAPVGTNQSPPMRS